MSRDVSIYPVYDYSETVIQSLKYSLEHPIRIQKTRVIVPDEVVAGALQLLLAQQANLRDVDRLDGLLKISPIWHIGCGQRIVSSGPIRSCIDDFLKIPREDMFLRGGK